MKRLFLRAGLELLDGCHISPADLVGQRHGRTLDVYTGAMSEES